MLRNGAPMGHGRASGLKPETEQVQGAGSDWTGTEPDTFNCYS